MDELSRPSRRLLLAYAKLTALAALAFGLDLLPLAEERYDLVVPREALGDARVARLLDELTTGAARRDLGALGYDVGCAGERVAEVSS